jgi:hypothetical protein
MSREVSADKVTLRTLILRFDCRYGRYSLHQHTKIGYGDQ